ncbi:MAG TPA: DUF308 domain-containing protein [Bacteroidales bacterium]|nr:DUF308 domain-containing protein [Bacteroidales bacterium]
MKTLRILAAILLLFSGVLHFVEYFNKSEIPGSIGILAFGVVYCIIGALLLNSKMYPVYLGIFIPLIGMTLSIIKFGIPELASVSALFKAMEIIAIVCCLIIIINTQLTRTKTVLKP